MPTFDLLTTADVARRLGVSPRQVVRLVRKGELDAHAKLAGKTGAYLFTPDAIASRATERAS